MNKPNTVANLKQTEFLNFKTIFQPLFVTPYKEIGLSGEFSSQYLSFSPNLYPELDVDKLIFDFFLIF